MVGWLHYFLSNTFTAILVEQLLLVVAGHPVTLSELEQESRLHLALSRDGLEASQVVLNEEYQCASLHALAIEWLIEAEANRINWPTSKVSEIEKAKGQWMQQSFAGPEDYQKFLKIMELSQADLDQIFARHLRVDSMMKHFIIDKIASERLLTDQAIADYYQANIGKYGTKEEAAQAYSKQVNAKVTGEWMADLLKRHRLQQVKIPEDVVANNALSSCHVTSKNLLESESR